MPKSLLRKPEMALMFVGYDHVLGKATKAVEDWLAKEVIGDVQSIDVEFREFWGGIFCRTPMARRAS